MSFFDSIRIGASGSVATSYSVDRSLRFNTTDQTVLTSSLSTSPTNRKKTTLSFWFKKSKLSAEEGVIVSGASGTGGSTSGTRIYLNADDTFKVATIVSNTTIWSLDTNRVFRDPSAWMHFCMSLDTTQSTASDRVKIYFNGVQETSFSSASYPSQDYDDIWAYGNYRIGDYGGDYGYYYGYNSYIAEVITIDGQALDPSSFTETDATTGQLIPKDPSGLTFGTNGFHLKFADNSGTTATTLGKDSSGNGNNFTPNNFVTGDAVKDSPTNNFATFRLYGTPAASGASLAEGNLKFTTGSSGSARNLNRQGISTFLPTSGKWYAEVRVTGGSENNFIGVGAYQVGISPSSNNSRYVYYYGPDGQKYVNTNGSESNANHGAGYGNNDIVGIYIDMDAGTPTVYFSKNGQWADGSGNSDESTPTSAITLGDTFFTTDAGGHTGIGIIVSSSSGGSNVNYQANFGQDSTFSGLTTAGGNTDANGIGDFKYTVPANALAMCSANLPDPTILLPNNHFDTLLYTGDGSSGRSITSLEFSPDWVWIKRRNSTHTHNLYDTVRGATKYLASSNTNMEYTESTWMTDFLSNGFEVGNGAAVNHSSSTYVAWNWDGGSTDGKTYAVTVVSDSGNKYRFDGFGTSAVTLDLAEGGTYVFDWSDSSAQSHPVRFSTTSDGTHGGGSEYTTGVVKDDSAYKTTITVAASAPTLYYYCQNHSGMGGQVNTNTTLGSSNFDGAIQSTAKVNASAGFSITTYTGTGSSTTVGHGLGVKPDAIIIKCRSNTDNWMVYHNQANGGSSPEDFYFELNALGANINSTVMLNDTAPTSSVVTIGSDNSVNGSSRTYVMYCFSEVAGYSKFGSYVGNSSDDGTFVFTGFRPAWLMVKRANGSNTNWTILDNKRDAHNVTETRQFANTSEADSVSGGGVGRVDFLSNGFKARDSHQDGNSSAGEYIYFAFAESPFKNARAR